MTPKIVSVQTPEPTQNAAPVHVSSTADHDRLALRQAILLQVAKLSPQGSTVAACFQRVRHECPEASVESVEQEIQYLLDKGLVVDVPQVISPEIHHYRIHAYGTDYLAERQLLGETGA